MPCLSLAILSLPLNLRHARIDLLLANGLNHLWTNSKAVLFPRSPWFLCEDIRKARPTPSDDGFVWPFKYPEQELIRQGAIIVLEEGSMGRNDGDKRNLM
jgi:hypothetical protein